MATESTAKLEELITQYEAAINARNQSEIDRLIVLVEKEADRIGYDNHRRLYFLHTAAEQVGEITMYNTEGFDDAQR